jgi:RHS repeat-associated protein
MKKNKRILAISGGVAALCVVLYLLIASGNNAAVTAACQPLPAEVRVNTSGALTWSMDIEVPPGIKGIEPALTLRYNSQGTNGLLGNGFSLEGLSAITRTGATLAEDGFFGGIGYNANDRFLLDGNRLMLMQGSTYGADGTVYHTSRESWSKVEAIDQAGSGPAGFKVWTKSGLLYEYGTTPDAAVKARAAAAGFPAGSVRSWLVNKCTDLHGNTLTISYTETPPDSAGQLLTACAGQGQNYPLRIDYTSNTNVNALRSVQFVYEYRPDSATVFAGGASFSTRARMKAICTYVKNESGDSTRVREVLLQYEEQSPLQVSRLSTVQVIGNDAAMAPTTFQWADGWQQFSPVATVFNGLGNNAGFVGDFNGDGRNDLLQSNAHVYLGGDSGFTDAGDSGLFYQATANNFSGDFNGDGLSDFFAAGSNGGTLCYFNPATHSFSRKQTITGLEIPSGCYPAKCVWQGDFNGDSRSDLCTAMGTTVFVNFGDSAAGLLPYVSQPGLQVMAGNTYAADFNGDGLSDLFSCSPVAGYLTCSNWSDSTGFRKTMQIPGMNFTVSSTQQFTWIGDYNGDKMADILARGTDSQYRIYYANGNGFQPGKPVTINLQATAVWPADFNHDGLMDFYAASTDSGLVYLSNGLDFSATKNVQYAFQPQYTWLGDFNGDGMPDLFNVFTKQLFYGSGASPAGSNQQGNLVTSITNGAGATYTATYKPITDNTVYSAADAGGQEGRRQLNAFNPVPLSPVQNQLTNTVTVQQAMYVVSRFTESDGRGNTYAYDNVYAELRYDKTGYGFLGYAFVQTTGLSQQAVLKTYLLQAFPFTSLPDSVALLGTSGEQFGSRSFEWQQVPVSGKSRVWQVQKKAENNYIIAGNKVQSVSRTSCFYDAFGNLRLQGFTGNVADGATLWKIASYSNDTENWQLGYVTAVSQSADSSGNTLFNANRMFYDNKRNVDSVQTWFSTTNTWLTKRFGYDVFGNAVTQVNWTGDSTTYVFDSLYHTYPIVCNYPKTASGTSLQETGQYEPMYGNMVSATDCNRNRFTYVYDGLGRPYQRWIPDSSGTAVLGMQTEYIPAATGYGMRQISCTAWGSGLNDTTLAWYDGLSRNYLQQFQGWNGKTSNIMQEFDAYSHVVKSTLPYFTGDSIYQVQVFYDPAGRTVKTIIPFRNNDSIVKTMQYNGLTTQLVTAPGSPDSLVEQFTTAWYNQQPCLVQYINAEGASTSYTWDLTARITGGTDPQGNRYASAWNSLNMNDWHFNPSSDTTFFRYNPLQNSMQTINAIYDTVSYQFDALGRITTSKARGQAPIVFQYDDPQVPNGLGSLCRVTQDNGASVYAFAYDAMGNKTAEQVRLDGHNWMQQMGYSPGGAISWLIFPDSVTGRWLYNATGQLTQITEQLPQAAPKPVTTVNAVNASGNWLEYVYGNGVSTQKTFYNDETLQGIQVKNTAQQLLSGKTYQWNLQQLISGITDQLQPAQNENYLYSATGRLLALKTGAFTDSMAYDFAGNITLLDSVIYSYTGYQVKSGTRNGLPVYAAKYNAAGLLTERTTAANATYRYTYDGYGQMDSVFRNDTLQCTYTYDFSGNRNRVIQNGKIRYTVSPVYSETIENGQATGYRHYSAGDAFFATAASDGEVQYNHFNQNGSTILLTSSTGELLQTMRYTPYGQMGNRPGDSIFSPYAFNGKTFDEAGGLYYFNSRYYDPVTARFVTPDNQLGGGLTTPDALNNYAFVNNSPVTYADPTGHVLDGTGAGIKTLKELLIGIVDLAGDVLTEGALLPAQLATDDAAVVEPLVEGENTFTADMQQFFVGSPDSYPETQPALPSSGSIASSSDAVDDNFSDSKKREATRKQPSRNVKSRDLDYDPAEINDDGSDRSYRPGGPARPSYGPGQIDAVWARASEGAGEIFCPNCETTKLQRSAYGQTWQMGHRPGYEFRHLYKLWNEKRINDMQYLRLYRSPEFYQPECTKCNSSHKFESKSSLYLKKEPQSRSDKGIPGMRYFYNGHEPEIPQRNFRRKQGRVYPHYG